MKAAANAAASAQRGSGGTATASTGTSATTTATFPTLDITQTGGWQPPDAALAVGPTSILVAVNEALAVYDKEGALLAGPVAFQTLFVTAADASIFDPRAIYDAAGGRFVLLAVQADSVSSIFYRLAVSKTPDPAGDWCTYALNAKTGSRGNPQWADFPGLGMDADRLYITSNQFTFFFPVQFKQSRLLVIAKSSVYSSDGLTCPTATSTAFNGLKNPDRSSAFTVQPAHQPVAEGSLMYFVNVMWPGGAKLALRSYNPSTIKLGAPKWVSVASYDLPADAPQPESTKLIDTGDTRLSAGAVHWGGAIYTSNTTRTVSGVTDENAYANIQWYKITPGSSTAPTVAVTNPSVAYFYPVVMPVSSSLVALAFNGSGPSQALSAYAKGAAGPVNYAAGDAAYELKRAGDYSAAAADPTESGKVWVLSMYAETFVTTETHVWWATAVASVTESGVTP